MIGRQALMTNICVYNLMRQQDSGLFYSRYQVRDCRLKGYLEEGELAADSSLSWHQRFRIQSWLGKTALPPSSRPPSGDKV
jgi:hypothetical protein